MGLSIARGMLMAQHGRISARNCEDGAEFTIVVPAESRPLAAGEPAM
jgi:K+-sensing histidine kinase KdpD